MRFSGGLPRPSPARRIVVDSSIYHNRSHPSDDLPSCFFFPAPVASPSTVSSASSLPAAAQDMTILQLRAIIAGVERRLNGRLDNLETRLDNSDEKVDQCANDIDTKVAVPLNNIVNLLALMMDRDGMAPVDSLSGIE
ncbi:hypothetical protein TrVFT333_003174 [Trichoderma virens FT-333]|nr:hypothetical protein TrVFT333_003174 [Trichoderma virens FT-333]